MSSHPNIQHSISPIIVNELKMKLAMLKDSKEEKDVDNFLDRKVIANLLFSLLSHYGRDTQKSRDILLVMSGILPFDATQRDVLQLPPIAPPSNTDRELREYMRDSLGDGSTAEMASALPVKSSPVTEPFQAKVGLADQFLSFLLRESRTARQDADQDYQGEDESSYIEEDEERPVNSSSIVRIAAAEETRSIADQIIQSPIHQSHSRSE